MYSGLVALAVVLINMSALPIHAYKNGIPYGICESFYMGHPMPEKTDVTLKLELLHGDKQITCFKPQQNYICKPLQENVILNFSIFCMRYYLLIIIMILLFHS